MAIAIWGPDTVSSASEGSWEALGPDGGFVWDVEISPAYDSDQTVFAGITGGVLRTTDGGDVWQRANRGLNSPFVPTIALSPDYSEDHTVFAGTTGDGVFRSTDGGESWQQIVSGLDDPFVEALEVSPNFSIDRTVFAGTFNSGVFRSVDGGETWVKASEGLSNDSVLSLAMSPNFAQDRTLFAGLRGAGEGQTAIGGSTVVFPDGGVFRSTDGGETWVQTYDFLVKSSINSLAVSPGFSRDRTVFVGTEDKGLHRSTDSGESWQTTQPLGPTSNVRSLKFTVNSEGPTSPLGGGVQHPLRVIRHGTDLDSDLRGAKDRASSGAFDGHIAGPRGRPNDLRWSERWRHRALH